MAENRNQELESARQEVRRVMERIGDKIPLKARQLVEDAVVKIKVDHVQPKVALGLSPEILEKGYRYGYNLFQAGKYQEALRVFEWLRTWILQIPAITLPLQLVIIILKTISMRRPTISFAIIGMLSILFPVSISMIAL